MNVKYVNGGLETKTNNSTTPSPLLSPQEALLAGINIANDSSATVQGSPFSAQIATQPKQQGSGTSGQPLIGGRKNDQEKIRLELISSAALLELGKVLTYGAKKYSSNNWRAGIAYSRIIGAILRHVVAYNSGEAKDPETELSHISHAMCECMFLLEFEQTHPELNDIYGVKK